MKHKNENMTPGEGFETTMLSRIRILGQREEAETLIAYTDPYYSPDVRLAAIAALSELPAEEASRALGIVARLYGDDVIREALGDAMLRLCEKRDVGPLSAAVYLSRQNRAIPGILFFPMLRGAKT